VDERNLSILSAFKEAFGSEPSVWVRAPGRVDLMGSHTDYNLGYVLTLPISRDTVIAARPRTDGVVRLRSVAMGAEDSFPIDAIEPAKPGDWTSYVRGVAAVLKEEGYKLTGLDGVIDTTIPLRSGLSSSAALECAVAVLFRELGGWQMEPARMAQLCQRAENQYAGVNCGILDQFSSCAGQAGCALLLDCRDLSIRQVRLAPGMSIVICDTRAKRSLAGSEYDERRADCELGAKLMGVASLRDSSLEQLESYKGTLSDQVMRRCRFILEENARVLALAEALTAGNREAIKNLFAESFRGAAELYEITAPAMHAMIQAMNAAPGVIGARQAGAGFGGCMVALVEESCVVAFSKSVYAEYQKSTGTEPQIYAVDAVEGAGAIEF